MPNTNTDAETITSILTLAGGVLSFSAVVIGIINAQLRKAKTAAARERVISNAFGLAMAGFPLAGLALSWGFGAERAALCLFGLGTASVSINYLRKTAPASRAETLGLVGSWCAMTSLIMFYWFERVLGLIGGMIAVIQRMVYSVKQ
jgi:hypothetical protein